MIRWLYAVLAFFIGGMIGIFGMAILASGARADEAQEIHYKKEI